MISRRLQLAWLAALLAPGVVRAVDFVTAPMPLQTALSASGTYAFEVALAPRWRVEPSTGTLYAVRGDRRHVVWQRKLPQRVQPRYVFVSNEGAVLLLDQFDRTKAPIAVLLINAQGEDVCTLSFDGVLSAVGVGESQVLHQARHGAWIQTPPAMSGDEVRVGVAGRALLIDMKTGGTRVAP